MRNSILNSLPFISVLCILTVICITIWSFGYQCGQTDGLRGKWYYSLNTNTVINIVNKR